MVQLIAHFSKNDWKKERGFNSKMVQLIVKFPSKIKISDSEFQFQNGAINSGNLIVTKVFTKKFQFQNGAINSSNLFFFVSYLVSFNSKMVQLIG